MSKAVYMIKSSLILSLILNFCTLYAQEKKNFILKGEFSAHITDTIYISYYSAILVLDTIQVEKGVFSYLGAITEPTLVTLKRQDNTTNFFVDPGITYIKLTKLDFSSGLEIKGSNTNDDMISRKKLGDMLIEKNKVLNTGKPLSRISFEGDTTFINANPTSYLSLYLLNFRFSDLAHEYVADRFKKIGKRYKQTSIGKELYTKLTLSKRSLPGTKLKNAKLYNENGIAFSLNDLLKDHKLLLIDFWASWCAPCRANAPFLKSLYSKNKSKGLEVLSLSIDAKKENWLNAIEKDSIQIWHNGIESYQGQMETLYGVSQIPTYILINNKGIIIGKYNGRSTGKADMEEIINRLLE